MDEAQIDEHVCSDEQLHHAPEMAVLFLIQEQADADAEAYVAEIQQIEQIVLRQPERDGHGLKDGEHDEGWKIFFHSSSFCQACVS